MTQPARPQKRVVGYLRDMSEDGPEQINLDGKPRPPELRKLMKSAREKPRRFDAVVVSSMTVLGTPGQAKTIIEELNILGIEVITIDGSTH